MKSVVYAPAALDSFDDILEYTADTFGEAQAVTYSEQLVARIEALAAGAGPRARPCAFLMRNSADAAGLSYYREASHFLILLETADTLTVVEILHGRMDLDRHLRRLAGEGAPEAGNWSAPPGLLQVLPRFLSCPSVARLFLVPEGQNIHRIVGRFVAVQGHIAGIPEGNHQLAQLGHFREWPANVRGRLQQQELPLNGLAGTPGGARCLDGQEPPASFQAIRRAFGDDYLWHSGTAFSSLVPQVFNQVRTSWPVRWRPVSL